MNIEGTRTKESAQACYFIMTDLHPEEQNFVWLSFAAVDEIPKILRFLLKTQIQETELYKEIDASQELKNGKNKLNQKQKELCFKPAPFVPVYDDFDTTLLYKLIRNLCPALKPSGKSGVRPDDTCKNIGDDIERLRIFRNDMFAHSRSAKVSNSDFNLEWNELESIFERISKYMIGKTPAVTFLKDLEKIKTRVFKTEDISGIKKRLDNELVKLNIYGDGIKMCGDTATFTAEIEFGSLDPDSTCWSLEWQHRRESRTNHLDIKSDKFSGSSYQQLVIPTVSRDDQGEYKAVISYELSSDFKLHSHSNPIDLETTGDVPNLEIKEVTSQQDDVVIDVSYSVSDESPAVDKIKWTKDEKPIPTRTEKYSYKGTSNKATLKIHNPTKRDCGTYTCTVSNPVGAVTKSKILDIPSVDIIKEHVAVIGHSVTITADIESCPPVECVIWEKMDLSTNKFQRIDITDSDKYSGSNMDHRHPQLVIKNAAIKDGLDYRLTVCNRLGKTQSRTFVLKLKGDPPSLTVRQTTNIPEKNVKLMCEVFLSENSPKVTDIVWIKNNQDIDVTGSGGKYSGGNLSEPSLTINSVDTNDGGKYQCCATNAVGNMFSEIIELDRAFIECDDSHYDEATDTFTWKLIIKSVPEVLRVQWKVKNSPTEDFQPIDVYDEAYMGSLTAFPHPVLVVHGYNDKLYELYGLQVSNFIGTTFKDDNSDDEEEDQGDSRLPEFFAHSGSTVEFRKLKQTIISEIDETDLPSLIQSLTDIADMRDSPPNVATIEAFFEFLLDKKIAHKENVIAIQYLMRGIGRKDLDKMCVNYAITKIRALCFYAEREEPENGYAFVQFHIAGNVKDFRKKHIRRLKSTVAAMVNCPEKFIKVDGLRPSRSFIIILLMKIERAMILAEESMRTNLKQLLKLNVDKIIIDGKEIMVSSKDVETLHRQREKMDGERLKPVKDMAEIFTSYNSLQSDVEDVFTSVKEFIVLPGYNDHIRGKVCVSNREDISIQLYSRKNDLMKTDCAIVVAGETSAGKSSVINLIIGDNILPMDITTTAYRVCRMRYSDKLQISTCDSEDRQIEVTECDDRKDMADKLSELARTKDEEIKYIDVWLPLDILKGNIIIVDTPGIGDKDRENVAEMMMDYIPNALAFVFVVNVANAGGLLSDRLVRILERVRGSLSFDPKDAIFLLNKWDSMKQNPRKSEWFVELKRKLHDTWKNVQDDYILKFAATAVKEDESYQREFDQFQLILKSIIAKNGIQRIKVYTELIRSFIKDCDAVVADKEKEAKKETEDDVKMLYKLEKKLQDTERKRMEALGNIPQMIDGFLEGTAIALHGYIHSQEFKTQILQCIGKYARFKIGSKIDSRIEKKTYRWQQKNMIEMFKRDVMGKVAEKIIDIPEALHRISDKVKGFTSPFDVENKIASTLVSFLAPSGTAMVGSILMTQLSVSRNAAIAVAATGLVGGLVFSGLVALDVLDDVDTTIENAYKARIGRLTTEKIKESLTKTYAEGLKNILQNFLEGDLEEEIDNLERLVAYTRKRVEYFQKQESDLIPLRSEISKIRERLNELGTPK